MPNLSPIYIFISIFSGLFFSLLSSRLDWKYLFFDIDPLWILLYITLAGLTLKCLLLLYDFFFLPLRYSRSAGEIQFPGVADYFKQPGGKLTLSRTLGEFPPPFPNGWYVLLHQGELKNGGVMPMNVCGKQYVLWRDMSGKAHLFDSYCAHLGANLALGGRVIDNCLKCPFHGWEYDTEGNCNSIPYASEPNKFVKLKSYTILEQDQLIYYWHDAEKREPYWYPPEYKEISDGQFTYHGQTEHYVFAHIQELPENGADVAHLGELHKQLNHIIRHHWKATWEALGSNSSKETPDLRKTSLKPSMDISKLNHWSQIELLEGISIFGYRIPFLDVRVYVNQIGPGIVWLRFHTPIGEALMISAATPFAPMLQRTYHFVWSTWTMPRFVAKQMLNTVGKFYEQDIMIWQWKTFPSKPGLVKEDGYIKSYRKWFSQYYSENSISFKEAIDTHIRSQNAVLSDW